MSDKQLKVKEAVERLRAGLYSGEFAVDPEEDLEAIEEAVLGEED